VVLQMYDQGDRQMAACTVLITIKGAALEHTVHNFTYVSDANSSRLS